MPNRIALLGDYDDNSRVFIEAVRNGLVVDTIGRLDELPGKADAFPGMTMLIADAEALVRDLEQGCDDKVLADVECIVCGEEVHRRRLSAWPCADKSIFLQHPVDEGFLAGLLSDFSDEEVSSARAIDAASPDIKLDRFGKLYGSSEPMYQLYRLLRRASSSDATLCLYGESGTGKELAAQAIHEFSSRRQHPLIAINCSAIPKDLFESELFGHEKGSFSGAHRQQPGQFENAGGGTLFLDEITEMDLDLQAKLLRVLETGYFKRVGGREEISCRARVITATNRKPADAVQDGRLREDLYYRVSQLEIHLPPLRDRGDDILHLARLFTREFSEKTGKKALLARATERLICGYHWPGNVRQLWNVIEVACTSGAEVITPSDLPELDRNGLSMNETDAISIPIGTSLREAERLLLQATLEQYGSKQIAADVLGISLRTLYNRLKEYGQ